MARAATGVATEAADFDIHTDRHLIGLPRALGDGLDLETPLAVYQTDQEGETRLFATGLYRDRLEARGRILKIGDKLVLLDTFASPPSSLPRSEPRPPWRENRVRGNRVRVDRETGSE